MNILVTIIIVILIALGSVFVATKDTPNTAEEPNQPVSNEAGALDLSGKNLSAVPEYVFGRTDIEALDLSHNNLSGALQAEVRHLQNLKTLDLSDNKFTGVPAEVGQLKNLQILDLSNNPISGLPYELGNLENLRLLDLRGTKYSNQDLEVIKKDLPAGVQIKTN
jgi:Leucine-rich repeat (LRR) protein